MIKALMASSVKHGDSYVGKLLTLLLFIWLQIQPAWPVTSIYLFL